MFPHNPDELEDQDVFGDLPPERPWHWSDTLALVVMVLAMGIALLLGTP